MKVLVAQSCLTLCDPMTCRPPRASLHGILQARILEWVAMSSSRGSSQPGDKTQVSCFIGRFFTSLNYYKPQTNHEYTMTYIYITSYLCQRCFWTHLSSTWACVKGRGGDIGPILQMRTCESGTINVLFKVIQMEVPNVIITHSTLELGPSLSSCFMKQHLPQEISSKKGSEERCPDCQSLALSTNAKSKWDIKFIFWKTLKYKVQRVAAPGEFLLHGSRVSPGQAKRLLNKDILTGDSLPWTYFSPSLSRLS